VLVVQRALGHAHALVAGQRHGVEPDPLAGRWPRQVEGEIGVEEDPVLEGQHPGHAVAEVGGRRGPLHAARLLVAHHRAPQPEPHAGRARAVAAVGEAQLHAGAVERGLLVGAELERCPLGHLRAGLQVGVVTLARGQLGPPDRHGVGPDHLGLLVAGADRHGQPQHPAAGPGHDQVEGQALQRHRPHQLQREAGQAELVARGPLDGAGTQRRHRAPVLVERVPGPTGVLRGYEVGAARLVQRLGGHPPSLLACLFRA
jgi:hypothetical protein